MHDVLLAPGLEDAWIAMAERRDTEASAQVEQLAAVREGDAAALGVAPGRPAPRHDRPKTRPTVARATVPAIAGFSCRRRNEY